MPREKEVRRLDVAVQKEQPAKGEILVGQRRGEGAGRYSRGLESAESNGRRTCDDSMPER